MQETFTEDQSQFREVVRKFLGDQSPMTAVRELQETESGFDAKVWQSLGQNLGLPGTRLPEAYGGLGYVLLKQSEDAGVYKHWLQKVVS